jgi:hypothetical protein
MTGARESPAGCAALKAPEIGPRPEPRPPSSGAFSATMTVLTGHGGGEPPAERPRAEPRVLGGTGASRRRQWRPYLHVRRAHASRVGASGARFTVARRPRLRVGLRVLRIREG